MQNQNLWKPSKFELRNNKWKHTLNTTELGTTSRFIASIQLRHYQQALIKYAHGKMLDLGCGKVPLYGIYRELIDEVVCADWVGTLHTNEHIDIYFDLNYEFPLDSNLFDSILATDVIEHLSSPSNFWRETYRVLKSEGVLIIGVPFFHKLHEEPFDFYRYTEFTLRKFCADYNFEIISLYPYGGSFEIFVDLIEKHLGWSKTLSKINYFCGNLISRSFIGRKIYSKTSAKFPLGYILIAKKR